MSATASDAITIGIVEVWNAQLSDVLPALEDTEKAPGSDFPYAVLVLADQPEIVTRMSGHAHTEKHYIYAVPFEFQIYTRSEVGDAKSAKRKAAELMERVLKAFGGHPTTPPATISVPTGRHLNTQLIREFGVREDDLIYQWKIQYLFTIDMPVATG